MQRAQDSSEKHLSDMTSLVKAQRTALPAGHHFTRFGQVAQLVGASEADADLGFMARLMALCSLPRKNPGDRIRYKRVNGPYTLYRTAGGGKLPSSASTTTPQSKPNLERGFWQDADRLYSGPERDLQGPQPQERSRPLPIPVLGS